VGSDIGRGAFSSKVCNFFSNVVADGEEVNEVAKKRLECRDRSGGRVSRGVKEISRGGGGSWRDRVHASHVEEFSDVTFEGELDSTSGEAVDVDTTDKLA
jgi:hypothetical protein